MALRVKLLTAEAKLPVRGSALAAGYDLCAAYSGVVPARGKALIKTDLAIAVPPGTYGRVGACPAPPPLPLRPARPARSRAPAAAALRARQRPPLVRARLTRCNCCAARHHRTTALSPCSTPLWPGAQEWH